MYYIIEKQLGIDVPFPFEATPSVGQLVELGSQLEEYKGDRIVLKIDHLLHRFDGERAFAMVICSALSEDEAREFKELR